MAINVSGKDLSTLIDEKVEQSQPTKLSQLSNDSNYVTTSGHVASAQTASSATNLTGNSGVSAGSFGPTSSVTVNINQTGQINVPYFTVNAQGRITSMGHRTLRVTSGCQQCSNCSDCRVTSGCTQCTQCTDSGGCSQSCGQGCSNCDCQP